MLTLMNALSLGCLASTWGMAAARYRQLPEQIPFHFALTGEPDMWAGRWTIFLAPFLQCPLTIVCVAMGEGAVRPSAVPTLPTVLLLLEVQALLAALCWRITEIALGRAAVLAGFWTALACLSVLLATCGLALPPR